MSGPPATGWRALAAALDLRGDPAAPRVWLGRVEGAELRFEVVPTGPTTMAVRVVSPTSRSGLTLGARAHVLTDDGRTTGDPSFDEAVFLIDPDPTVHGLLDGPLRARIVALVARGVHVIAGEVRLEPWAMLEPAALDPADLEQTVRGLASLAAALSTPSRDEAIQRLCALAEGDPLVGVRARCRAIGDEDAAVRSALARHVSRSADAATDDVFAALTRQLGDAGIPAKTRLQALQRLLELFPLARCAPLLEALPAALQSGAVRVLVRRAQRSEPDVAAILELLAAMADPRRPSLAPDALLEVATFLGQRAATTRGAIGVALMVQLLDATDPRVFDAALAALMRLPEDLGVTAVRRLLPTAHGRASKLAPEIFAATPSASGAVLAEFFPVASPRLQTAYLRALATLGDPRWARVAESALSVDEAAQSTWDYRGVERADWSERQLAAIDCLAAIGDASSIAALTPLSEGLFRSGRVKAQARAALAAIRARLGAEGGELSLTSGGGELSLPDPER